MIEGKCIQQYSEIELQKYLRKELKESISW